ncbi:MAG: ABC transporter substrate-binding protein [Actinomycetota bacterium]|nr:ABC transporter substrate-binding protein [Actinomycetota bacterium]
MSKPTKLVTAFAVIALVAGCSSSTKPTSAGGSGGGTTATTAGTSPVRSTVTVGILTDLTGLAASGNKTSVQGAEAAANTLAAQAGIHLKFVQGDTQSSPSGALSAAKQMVEQDNVSAVVAVSALTFGAASYLTSKGIPVVGTAEDGPEWITSKNMFSAFGFLDQTKIGTTYGALFKMLGVNTMGSLGYGISPSSAEAAKNAAASSKAEGVKVGYLNANFPFGSTNVAPIALAMKNNGVEGFVASVDPNTGFALVTALRQVGADLEVALLPTGYGGDLDQAGPGALTTGQGVYFYTSFEPVEMHTAATDRMQAAMRTVGVTSDPTYGEYAGYVSTALLVDALKTLGANPSTADLVTALNGVKGFDGAGLFGHHSFDLSNRPETARGVDGCIFVTKLEGKAFTLVPGADPICGTPLPNVTLSDT